MSIYYADDIMASFWLHKMVPELIGNKSRLELDIYEEIGIPNSTVHPPSNFLYLHIS
jgi:hypothetical protein